MPSITQTIPNYVSGISEQPDELKTPGQLTVAKNVLPDVTQGLVKRPGGKLIGESSMLGVYNTNSKWFSYYRDENEQYIGRIQDVSGGVKIWRCSDGQLMNVTNTLTNTTIIGDYSRDTSGVISLSLVSAHGLSIGDTVSLIFVASNDVKPDDNVYEVTEVVDDNNFKVKDNVTNAAITSAGVSMQKGYLIHSSDEQLQTLTLNDYTYITNRQQTVAMLSETNDKAPVRPPEAFIELKKVAYANQYSVNLFDSTLDDTSTTPHSQKKETITTATRVKVASSSLDDESSCPNVGTEIFNVGTANQDLTNVKQKIKFSQVTVGDGEHQNFFCKTDPYIYSLVYVPPAWTTNTYYQAGDLVSATNSSSAGQVYKATTSGTTTTNDTAPTVTTGNSETIGAIGWTAVGTSTYSANTDVESTQLYEGQACIEIAHNIEIDSQGALDTLVTEWAANDGANFPFEIETKVYNDEHVTLTYTWKNEGEYGDQLSRIILSKTNGTTYTIGGNNVSSATDGALITDHGKLELTRIGWGGHNVLEADRSDLYFRLTTTGQAVPTVIGTGSDATTTYSCRYTTTIDLLHGGSGWIVGDKVQVRMKDGVHVIEVEEISTSKVRANLGLIRPTPTSFDTKTTVTAESILGNIRSDIVDTSNFTDAQVEQIGNGLYITRTSGTFNISTPVSELLNVLSNEVKDVADLPQQCKHGYVVKVANSEADEDDYYVKFVGNNDRDGKGVWEECVKPGDEISFDPATMPIQIVREANGSFTVKQIPTETTTVDGWAPAKVGETASDGTNPRASFVGKKINKMLFFRNRLVMLSDENVIMSRPGDFFNFWAKSAISYTATDNIDISCSSEYPAIVYDGIQVNSGLVLFTKNQQFMLTTDSDVLSPLTAKINALSSYNFNYKSNPISLGTTIAFLDNAGKYNRFWEMTAVLREGEPNVIEQSKAISKSFNSDIDMVANSRENQVIFFGKKGTSTLYGFRYHTTSAQRIQQAWFTWELSGDIQHIAMLDDALFAIIKDGSLYTIQRFSIRGLSDSIYITDDRGTDSDTDDLEYKVHLDNARVIPADSLGYSSSTGKTSFTLPTNFDETSTNNLAVFCHSAGDDNGRYTEQVSIIGTGVNANIEFSGDWTGSDITVGYLYDMEIQFPTIYLQQQSNEQFRSQIHSSLVIHRVKLSLGPSGYYKTTVARVGKSDFIQEDQTTHESPVADNYNSNRVAVNNVLKQTVPVYEKNTNLTLSLKSTHPTPATLYSMTWEGDYTNKFYKSV